MLDQANIPAYPGRTGSLLPGLMGNHFFFLAPLTPTNFKMICIYRFLKRNQILLYIIFGNN